MYTPAEFVIRARTSATPTLSVADPVMVTAVSSGIPPPGTTIVESGRTPSTLLTANARVTTASEALRPLSIAVASAVYEPPAGITTSRSKAPLSLAGVLNSYRPAPRRPPGCTHRAFAACTATRYEATPTLSVAEPEMRAGLPTVAPATGAMKATLPGGVTSSAPGPKS